MNEDMNALPYYAMQQSARTLSDRHRRLVSEAAYFRAERRGFAPGHELEDWLAAEAEVQERLSSEAGKL